MTTVDSGASPNVYPSGFASVISAVPIAPPAPGRFTTAMPLGNFRFIPSTTARSTTSARPPAG